MSSRSTSKAATTLVEFDDAHRDNSVMSGATDSHGEQTTTQQVEAGEAYQQSDTVATLGSDISSAVTETQSGVSTVDGPDHTTDPEIRPDDLAQQLDELVRSVGVVEELSRRAREAATNDLARYDALLGSQQQYADRLHQARSIADQAHGVLQQAFGHEARAAAQPLVADAERVLRAFADLATAWQEQASAFIAGHPDVELLLAERCTQEERAREQEALAARTRKLEALVQNADAALEQGLINDGRRALAVLERDFADEMTAIERLRLKLSHKIRAEKDAAARQALELAAEHNGRGDLDGAVAVLEQVDVHGLSLDLSEDVFGRWSDACSRLAQAAGAALVRSAPAQGRGLILYSDPAFPNGLVVFSSLGMGPGFPQGTVVSDPAILRRARPFREAAPLPITSWTSPPTSTTGATPAALIRH
jgi:hypothetical protein